MKAVSKPHRVDQSSNVELRLGMAALY